MLKNFLSFHKRPVEKRFKLLQSFSIVSFCMFSLTTSLLAIFYRQQAVRDLVISTEENNIALTQTFSNTLWPKYGNFLSSTQVLSDQELVDHPRTQELYEETIGQFSGLSIVKIKVFDLSGRTVFSTDKSQMGDDKSQSSGFILARAGQVTSQLGHRDTFKALQDTLQDRHLLSSYIPIYNDVAQEEIAGVFELYSDVTHLLERIERTQRRVVLGSAMIQLIFYITLFLFVSRADRLLEKQYRQVQEQAIELETTLTKLRETQSQMLQSEKMSSLGQMVAGVAHEINNPVSFIHSNLPHIREYVCNLLRLLNLYEKHYPEPASEIQAEAEAIDLDFIQEDLPRILSSMNVGSKRIREIVLALRIFSRLDESNIKLVDIHEGLDSTLMLLKHRISASPHRTEIQILKDYGTIPKVECYAGLLNQVFMNILANAIDALDEKVQNHKERDDAKNLNQIILRTAVADEKWIEISIADNGLGMSQATQEHMFEPFFTTKPVGRGTGMGMSLSYQIITERHRGELECYSTINEGTEFLIRIPIRSDLASRKPKLHSTSSRLWMAQSVSKGK
ncbi:MAG: ATP-binding protein [Cyanobacteria bacterium J06638_28]